MNPVMSAVVAFLDAEGWAHVVDPEGRSARMRYSGQLDAWDVLVVLLGEPADSVVVYSRPNSRISPARRSDVGEAILRLNFGMVHGNWELDVDQGTIRFKTSADLGGVEPTAEIVGRLIARNVVMVERYLPVLLSVAYGQVEPAVAVADAVAKWEVETSG